MHRTLVRHGRQNVIGYLALFVALGGTSYAAINLPANSVGPRQLKTGAVTPKKIKAAAVDGTKVKDGSLKRADFAAGQLPTGARGPAGANGAPGASGAPGTNGTNGTNATIDGVAAGGSLTGTYPAPTIASGVVAPAMFGTIPAVRATKSGDQPLAVNTTAAVTFNGETFDNSAMHDNVTNNTRVTAPVAGTYLVTATLYMSIAIPSSWNAVLRKQGNSGVNQFALASRTETGGPGTNAIGTPLTGILQLAAGDYVDMLVTASSGGSVTGAFTSLSMAWIGRG